MATTNKTNRSKRIAKILEGFGKHFQNVSSLTIGGVSYTPQALATLLQGDLTAMSATGKARAVLATTVEAERNAHAEVNPVLRLLKAYVIATFGDSPAASQLLEDFGFKPRKSPTTTLEAKVGAQEKAKATRKARNTVGPKKKAAIHGAPVNAPLLPKV